ncbi:glycerate kinase [Leucobacter sp. UCMA 4100]|uniref:glycerate kinase family protein n=1 Tax=Leucobacter sp. UCMA 4100 TaxID=2810534 RepID=UPI0022EA3FB1|nr:glycerate kinase [Leucobacter sp. UCMA 4100]MDA3146866.1 glycerate kinase [Leucobacter sp. UCMA 4100]
MTEQTGKAAIVVCAPDSFKGTHTAAEVAEAMRDGVLAAGGRAICLPIADGGEGTIATIHAVLGGEYVETSTVDPMGGPLTAHYLRVGDHAYVEMAIASGIQFAKLEGFDALRASTRGTGLQIVHALRAGCRSVTVAVGGSSTSDGGRGAIEALSEAGLAGAASGDGAGQTGATIAVLTDVETPYEQAAEVFGPQKGVLPGQIDGVTERLRGYAETLPRSPIGVAYTGAGGGLSGALWAACGAELVSGIDSLLGLVGFEEAARGADLVLTGEGRFDGQSESGKVVSGVLRASRGLGVACTVIAGQLADGGEALAERMGFVGAMTASTLDEIREAAREATQDAAREATLFNRLSARDAR